jgi:aryl-alcohol dehydrogenase-like predicted oxidoreductase
VEYRQLGKSDMRVSAVGLGGNTFGPPRIDQEMTTRNIQRALELGINFIDTAIIYSQGKSEEFIGNALKGRRSEAIIATKFTLRNLEGEAPRQRILRQCEESLRKLQTDHIDLYQLHFPSPSIPPEEVLRPLDDLVKQGKVRYIGQSNHAAWRHCAYLWTSRRLGLAEFVTCQNHYNLVHRHPELETLPFCQEYGIGFIPYFPLGGGFLTGKYRPGEPPPPGTRGAAGSPIVKRTRTARNETLVLSLEAFAKERGHTVTELAIAWLLAHPEVCVVITGTSNPQQVEENAKSADWRLTPEEREQVDQLAAWDGSGASMEGAGF